MKTIKEIVEAIHEELEGAEIVDLPRLMWYNLFVGRLAGAEQQGTE